MFSTSLVQQQPYLSMSRAIQSIRAATATDHPKSVTLTGCQRLRKATVSCTVIERGITEPTPIISTETSGSAELEIPNVTAHLHKNHVTIKWGLV
jgi:hypothetical protein